MHIIELPYCCYAWYKMLTIIVINPRNTITKNPRINCITVILITLVIIYHLVNCVLHMDYQSVISNGRERKTPPWLLEPTYKNRMFWWTISEQLIKQLIWHIDSRFFLSSSLPQVLWRTRSCLPCQPWERALFCKTIMTLLKNCI